MATTHHLSLKADPTIYDNEVRIYPNPTTGTLCIKTNSSEKIQKIELIDMLGEIHPIEITSAIANIQDYKSGVYLLKISLSDQSVVLHKVIKQ